MRPCSYHKTRAVPGAEAAAKSASDGRVTNEGIWVRSPSGAEVVRSRERVVSVVAAKDEERARI